MANISVTATTPTITVDSNKSNVTVGSTQSNIIVGSAVGVSNAAIRNATDVADAGGDGSLTYSKVSGIYTYTGPSQTEVRAHFSNVSPINLTTSGEISIDDSALFSGKTTDNLTEGTNNLYYTTARANLAIDAFMASPGTTGSATVGGDLNVSGNLEVTGNINYREVEDLLVQDQSITLNYGNVSANDAFIYVDRSGSGGGTNAHIQWNETKDHWVFTNQVQYTDATHNSGTQNGAISFDLNNGQLFTTTLSGDITGITFNNIAAGSHGTIFITQDSTGFREITGYPGSGYTNVKFANNYTTLSSNPANVDVVNFINDGTNTYLNITNIDNAPVGGAKGQKGEVGNTGGQGTQGAQGTQGVQGDKGQKGQQGTASSVPGPTGPQGPAGPGGGPTGPTGPQGPQGTAGTTGPTGPASTVAGPQGPQGAQGAQGTQGPQGAQGSAGATGPTGPQGPAGGVGALTGGKLFLGSTSDTSIQVTPDSNFDTGSNTISLSTTITDVNSIASATSSNISLDVNTKAVKILKDFASVTSQDTLILDSDGYRPIGQPSGSPTSYSGTGLRRNAVHEGSVTAGSPVVTVTASAVAFWYGTPSAAQRTNAFANLATNCMFVTRSSLDGGGSIGPNTTTPFPLGTRILSVDPTAFTITMTQNATASATFSQASGTAIFTGDGSHDTSTTFGEIYVTNADFNGGSDQSIEFVAFTGSTDNLSYGASGPQTADLTTSVASGTITHNNYFTSQRSKLTTNLGYTASKNGFTVGTGATLSSRFENDNFATKGINILHDGSSTFSTEFGDVSFNSQYGIKQYTDNCLQNFFPTQGPRVLLSSAKGTITSDPFTVYPRSGQSLGQIAWQATTGKTLTPSSLRVPVYINAIAAEDHSLGSNTNIYHGVTSNSDNLSSSNKAHIYLASQNGRTILAAGEKGTTKEPIYFAPAQQPSSGHNVNTAYDFTTIAGQKAWAKMNYADTSATSGAELTVTHGQSRGAGTVGNQVVKLQRTDNSFNIPNQFINADNSPNNVFGPGIFGQSFDAIGSLTSSGNYVNGTAVVISGFTGSPFAALNTTTKYLKFLGNVGSIAIYELYNDAALSSGFQSGVSGVVNLGPGVFTYTATQASGVTNKSYSLVLEEQNDILKIKEDTTSRIEIQSTNTTFNHDIISTGTYSGGLKKFNETVVALGSVNGDQSSALNATNGSIYTLTATGGITINTIANAVAGTSMTIIITQDGTGSRLLTSTMKFIGGSKTLSTAAGSIDVISVVYDGTNYLASLTKAYA